MKELRGKQMALWQASRAQIENRHEVAFRKLDRHHTERLASMTVDIDKRLAELNSLSSRAAALFDRESYQKEIAYLVATRQRSVVDEKARQEKVKDDLRRDQERELAEAKAKHERLAALQQKALEDAENRRSAKGLRSNPQHQPRNFER